MAQVTLTELPERMRQLPKDERGYPVPWFVEWIDGKPQFPIMDHRKYRRALTEPICWVCGGHLGTFKTFVIGPMCGVSLTSGEPPAHRDCATFSAQNCPFLVNKNMKRIENELTKDGTAPAGVMIKRNPGVVLLWVTKAFTIFRDPNGQPLIHMGVPVELEAWTAGHRTYSLEVVNESIRTGLPALEAMCQDERDHAELKARQEALRKILVEHGVR